MRTHPNMSRQTRRLGNVISPLTRAEIKHATAAAVEHLKPELAWNVDSRYRVLGAELSLTRPRDKNAPVSRRIEVLIIDYLGRRQLRVGLERARVVEVRPLEGQAAYAPDEVAEAISLARTVPALRTIARRKGVFVSPFAPGGSDPSTRRVGLHFVQARGKALALLFASAQIDLNEQRLIDYVIHPTGKLAGAAAS